MSTLTFSYTDFQKVYKSAIGLLNVHKRIDFMKDNHEVINLILEDFFSKETYVMAEQGNYVYFHPRRGYRLKRRLFEILSEDAPESWLLGEAEHSLKTLLDFCYDFWKERDETCIIKKPTIEDIHEYAIKYNRVFQEAESDDWN